MRLKLLAALTLVAAPLLMVAPLARARPPALPAAALIRRAIFAAPHGAPRAANPNVIRINGSRLELALVLRQVIRTLQAGQASTFTVRWKEEGEGLRHTLVVTATVSAATGRGTLDDWLDAALQVWATVDLADHVGTIPYDLSVNIGPVRVGLKGTLKTVAIPKLAAAVLTQQYALCA